MKKKEKEEKAKLYTDMSFKWLDFRLQDLTEKKVNEDSYHSGAVDKFIKDNEEYSEMSLPRLKLFGDKNNTKFLNVSYDALRQISKILKKMKI